MAVACVFSLTQSSELRPEIAKSGAADLALEALSAFEYQGLEKSEYLLAQLAVVAQMARDPQFCRRLAAPEIIDLLTSIARLGTEDTDSYNESSDEEQETHVQEGCGEEGGRGGCSPVLHPGRRKMRGSGHKIKVACLYAATLRYCVVTIAESLGWSVYLSDGSSAGGRPSRMDIACMAVRMLKTDFKLTKKITQEVWQATDAINREASSQLRFQTFVGLEGKQFYKGGVTSGMACKRSGVVPDSRAGK